MLTSEIREALKEYLYNRVSIAEVRRMHPVLEPYNSMAFTKLLGIYIEELKEAKPPVPKRVEGDYKGKPQGPSYKDLFINDSNIQTVGDIKTPFNRERQKAKEPWSRAEIAAHLDSRQYKLARRK